MTKKTLGELYLKTTQAAPESVPVTELARYRLSSYMDQVVTAIKHAQKKWDCSAIPCKADCGKHDTPVANCYAEKCAQYCKQREAHLGDLFIEVQEVPIKLMPGQVKHQFYWKIACPRPTYDQTLFHYCYKTDDLTYLWTIPSKDVCLLYLENANKVVPEERQLLDFICKFADGTLHKVMKAYNGEAYDSPLLIK